MDPRKRIDSVAVDDSRCRATMGCGLMAFSDQPKSLARSPHTRLLLTKPCFHWSKNGPVSNSYLQKIIPLWTTMRKVCPKIIMHCSRKCTRTLRRLIMKRTWRWNSVHSEALSPMHSLCKLHDLPILLKVSASFSILCL